MNEWVKASFCSSGECVEVKFRKSTASGADSCVEVAMRSSRCNSEKCVDVETLDDVVLVRDSKQGVDGPVLRYTFDEWDAFIKGVKAGEFDL